MVLSFYILIFCYSWAFAVVAAFESFNMIYNRYTILFSEQNLIDSISIGGCTGGFPGKK
jgi:hypothetical protein